jgi:hypothetical protein
MLCQPIDDEEELLSCLPRELQREFVPAVGYKTEICWRNTRRPHSAESCPYWHPGDPFPKPAQQGRLYDTPCKNGPHCRFHKIGRCVFRHNECAVCGNDCGNEVQSCQHLLCRSCSAFKAAAGIQCPVCRPPEPFAMAFPPLASGVVGR